MQINTQRTLRMEGANSSTSCTLGCAEDLSMRIVGDVSFTLHAHVVRTAPFRLLLGHPFHHLLLCRLEDQLDRVDVSIRDPSNPARAVAMPSRARQGAQVGFVSALAYQVSPASLYNNEDNLMSVLAYKKVARKVHPVAASLPEDFRIIR